MFGTALVRVGAIIAVFLTALFVIATPRGISLTDSGFYLNSIAYSAEYRYGSDFGLVYLPLLDLLNGNWGLLRLVVYSLNAVLSAGLFWFLLKWLKKNSGFSASAIDWSFIVSVGAFGSSLMLHWWLPTPNYNTLAFQGALVFALGLIVVMLYGWSHAWIIGLGVFASLLGKPTTGAVLLLSVPALYFLLEKRKFAAIGLAVASLLTLTMLWANFQLGGFNELFDRVTFTVATLSALDAGTFDVPRNESLLNFVWKKYSPFYALTLPGALGLMFFFIGLTALIPFNTVRLSQRGHKWRNLILTMVALGGLVIFALFQERGGTALLSFFFPVSTIMAAILFVQNRKRLDSGPSSRHYRWRGFVLAGLFFCFPLALGLGTSNNLLQRAEAGSVFYLVSAILIASSIKSDALFVGRVCQSQVVLSGFFLVVTFYVMAVSVLNPYEEQGSILEMKMSDVIRGVHVSSETDSYLSELSNTGGLLGISDSTPIFDNTGASPTAMFALGGLPIGSAWIQGGWGGSQQLARLQISTYGKECLARSWVLDEPDGELRVFGDFGIELGHHDSYVEAHKLVNPRSGNMQILYRPNLGNDGEANCAQNNVPPTLPD
jgi:hypothetical protein